MKRFDNLYSKICNIDNLILAEKKARKGKKNRKDVKIFLKDKYNNLLKLREILINKEYKTSKYYIFKLFDPKERIIYKLPYYPDRIVHHAIMNILESIFISTFISQTYNCIKKRGIYRALKDLNKALKDRDNTIYCLKLDIRKFYPNINHEILKSLLRKKFKDKDLLILLDEIIDSTSGIPIGNYLSQYFANFYLTYFDHWIKESLRIKYYFKYCDDIVILGNNKKELWLIFNNIREYLRSNLKLKVKYNYQIFPINKRGIDFVGYISYHDYILLRSSIKRRFIRMIKHNKNKKSISSYNGWLNHCNSINLKRKYLCL